MTKSIKSALNNAVLIFRQSVQSLSISKHSAIENRFCLRRRDVSIMPDDMKMEKKCGTHCIRKKDFAKKNKKNFFIPFFISTFALRKLKQYSK